MLKRFRKPKPCAGCIFYAEDTGRLLIAQRSSEVNHPGTWSVWGGAINPGESPEAAAKREAREEACYDGSCEMILAHFYNHGDYKYQNCL